MHIARTNPVPSLGMGYPDGLDGAMVVYSGVTTADGNIGGTTLIDSNLAALADYSGLVIRLINGSYRNQARCIILDILGTVTVDTPYSGQVPAGTSYLILCQYSDVSAVIVGIASLVAAVGDPTAHTLTSLTTKWGDIARSLTDILGTRWDLAGDLGTDIVTLMGMVGPTGASQGLFYYGVVTGVPGANQFTIAGLAGLGDTKFVNWGAYVFRDAAGGGGAPQNETRTINAYTSAAGTFTTAAFSAAVAIGDEIVILHPRLTEIASIKAVTDLLPDGGALTDLATLEGRLTAARAGYLDELAAANIPADVDTINLNQGDPSGDTLVSTTTKLGDLAISLATLLGARWNGGGDLGTDIAAIIAYIDDLETRLTATRAGYLDQLGPLAIPATLTAIVAYVDELETRLTAARAGYLDELAAANIPADIDTLLARLTALRAGYLDELGPLNIPADIDTLLARLTAARAGYLDELAAANIPADIDALTTNLGSAVGHTLPSVNAKIGDIARTLDLILGARWDGAGDLGTDIAALLGSAAAALAANAYKRQAGVTQIFQKAITSAANAGAVVAATVTTASCKLKAITVKAVTASQADLTNIKITCGATGQITLIDIVKGAKANLTNIDDQVCESDLDVELAAGKTITITLTGTGATAVDLLITFEYISCVDSGYLA